MDAARGLGGRRPLSRALGFSGPYLTMQLSRGKPFSWAACLNIREFCGIPLCAIMERDRPIADCLWDELGAVRRIRPPITDAELGRIGDE